MKNVLLTGIKLFCALFLLSFLCGCTKQDKAISFPIGSEINPEKIASEDVSGMLGADSKETKMQNEKNVKESAQTMYYVHVCGEVVSPGLYELMPNCRVDDAIKAAGGFTENASEDYLNLAQELKDGMKLFVPSKEEAVKLQTEATREGNVVVSINSADVKLLCTLSGIGESRAKDIIAFREENGAFEKIEDIMKVPGIKESVFLKIKDHISVD